MPYAGVETAGKTLRSVCNNPFQPHDIFVRFISQLSDFFGQLFITFLKQLLFIETDHALASRFLAASVEREISRQSQTNPV